MVKVTRSNPKAFDTIDLRMKELESQQARIGWFETAKYEDGTPVAYVAAIQEMGYGPIPPRSFFRTTANEQKSHWKEIAAYASKQIIEGAWTPSQGMQALADQVTADISKKISEITEPALSPITIMARKYRRQGKKVTGKTIGEIAGKIKDGSADLSGVSTKPLVDSGLMLATLTNSVESV